MSTPDGHLELLLAHAGRGRPVLDEGLPDDAVDEAPNPETSVRGDDAPRRRRSDADPNNLTLQRWGLVAPEGDEGDRMLEAISPLIRLRENEQGARACIYRVKPDLDAEASVRWKDEVYWARDVRQAERPLYLLMLGDLHQTSVDLQHSLANTALVGRVHFADEAGRTNLRAYEEYANKVVRYARRRTTESSPNLLYYVASAT